MAEKHLYDCYEWYNNFGIISTVYTTDEATYYEFLSGSYIDRNSCKCFVPKIGSAIEIFIDDQTMNVVFREASNLLFDNIKTYLDIIMSRDLGYLTNKEVKLLKNLLTKQTP